MRSVEEYPNDNNDMYWFCSTASIDCQMSVGD